MREALTWAKDRMVPRLGEVPEDMPERPVPAFEAAKARANAAVHNMPGAQYARDAEKRIDEYAAKLPSPTKALDETLWKNSEEYRRQKLEAMREEVARGQTRTIELDDK